MEPHFFLGRARDCVAYLDGAHCGLPESDEMHQRILVTHVELKDEVLHVEAVVRLDPSPQRVDITITEVEQSYPHGG